MRAAGGWENLSEEMKFKPRSKQWVRANSLKRRGKNFFRERYPQRAMTREEPRVLQK